MTGDPGSPGWQRGPRAPQTPVYSVSHQLHCTAGLDVPRHIPGTLFPLPWCPPPSRRATNSSHLPYLSFCISSPKKRAQGRIHPRLNLSTQCRDEGHQDQGTGPVARLPVGSWHASWHDSAASVIPSIKWGHWQCLKALGRIQRAPL